MMFEIGDTGTYILEKRNYYVPKYICDVPMEAAVEWVRCSDRAHHRFSDNRVLPQIANGRVCNWLNKRFYVVDERVIDGDLVALYNYDGVYKLYTIFNKI